MRRTPYHRPSRCDELRTPACHPFPGVLLLLPLRRSLIDRRLSLVGLVLRYDEPRTTAAIHIPPRPGLPKVFLRPLNYASISVAEISFQTRCARACPLRIEGDCKASGQAQGLRQCKGCTFCGPGVGCRGRRGGMGLVGDGREWVYGPLCCLPGVCVCCPGVLKRYPIWIHFCFIRDGPACKRGGESGGLCEGDQKAGMLRSCARTRPPATGNAHLLLMLICVHSRRIC